MPPRRDPTHISVSRPPEGLADAAEVLAAVRRVVGKQYDLLGEMGHAEGTAAYLARDLRDETLVALSLRREGRDPDGSERYALIPLHRLGASVPARQQCERCHGEQPTWTRWCERCGADLSGIGPTARVPRAELATEAARVAEGEYGLLGEMERAQGGGSVWFARELESRRLVALRLVPDDQAHPTPGYRLALIQPLGPLPELSAMRHNTPTRAMRALGVLPKPPQVRDVSEVRSAALEAETTRRAAEAASRRRSSRRLRTVVLGAVPTVLVAAAVVFGVNDAPRDYVSEGSVDLDSTIAVAPRPTRTAPAPAAAPPVALDAPDSTRPPLPDSTRPLSAAAPAPTSAPTVGHLRLLGRLPTGAVLTVDGVVTTGRVLALPPGRHRITVEARGYRPATIAIGVRSGDTIPWRPRLTRIVDSAATPRPAAPPPASLASAPPSAELALSSCQSAFARADAAALDACTREAEAGRVDAMLKLALLYVRGQHVAPSVPMAAQWLERAASAGSNEARYRMALLYHEGAGVPRDRARASRLLRDAASGGWLDAQVRLADALQRGDGMPKDVVEAATWYRRAADEGHPLAQARLGMMLLQGKGVTRDEAAAATRLRGAAAQNVAVAQVELAKLYAAGRGVARSDSAATYWFRRAASLGDRDAVRELRRRGIQ